MRFLRWVFALSFFLVCLAIFAVGAANVAAVMRETRTVEELAPKTGRWVQIPEGRIFVQEAGKPDAPPVLLIHGTAAWSEVWRPAMNALAAGGYRAIAMDVPPFGFSERPRNADFTRATQAARIIATLDALKIDKVQIVAHSIGAAPAMEAILRAQERFSGVVLVCGALGVSKPSSPPEGALAGSLIIPLSLIVSSRRRRPIPC